MSKYDSQFLKLSDVGTVGRGKSKHRPRNDSSLYGGKYPFIQTGDVKSSNFYITDYSQTYNEKGLAQSKLWNSGTLCITIAANIGDTAILKIPACFPDSIIGFIPYPDKSDIRLVKYCLDTYKLQIRSISQGTTQDNLSVEKLLSIKLRIPSLPIQKKIAAVLSAYDDLIENNDRRITLLEKMAEEIYREWFVRLRFPGHEQTTFHKGIPEGWKLVSMGTLCKEIRNGVKIKNLDINTKYLGLEHLPRKSILINNFTSIDSVQSDKLLFNARDILFGKIRPYLHKIVLADFDGACSSDTIILRSKKNEYEGFLLFTIFSDTFVELATISSKGTKMPRADWGFLKELEIILPSPEILSLYQEKFNAQFALMCKISNSNNLLKQTRDRLLTRLISGKLSVEDLDIHFPPSMTTDP
jgi:type I restriction enzyme, S subunit